ncbi:MAG: hypothetical protein Kow0031_20180 [Anaerolineae bacterium]
MTVVADILAEAGYGSSDALMHDWALMIALSKIEQFQAECDFFSRKYNTKFETLEQLAHQEKGSESFEQEEDLEDWEFALRALEWWQARLEELHAAANH